MKAQIKGTYGKTRNYKEISHLPEIGEEWHGAGYEDAEVVEITNINDEIAETTAGNPTIDHDFYRVSVKYDDDIFEEYIVIDKD